MNIAYFNATLKYGQDGVTRVMYNTFDAAIKQGIKCIAFGSALPPVEQQTIPMYRVPSVPLPLQKAYRVALPYQSFAKTLLEFKPDLIHVNSPCTLGYAALKFARQFDIPIVATYHTHFPTYPRYYNLHWLEETTWKIIRYFYNQLDRTFVPTQPILNELRDHGLDRLQYLPNGIDRSLFSPERRSEEWRTAIGANAKPVVLFVSRLVWEKDLRVLAEIYTILRSGSVPFEMVVVGDGHARRELETMMPGAHFLGFQSGADLSRSFASSDIFVFPSTTETFGLVTVEAMASGLVPVAARAGGAIGIIEEEKSGLFSEPRDSVSLVAQVKRLVMNPAERALLAEGALQRAEHYEWKNIVGNLFDAYGDVIRRHRIERRVAA